MATKQTAVDWLIEQIIKYELVPKGTNKDNVLFHKAKQMEKEQIQKAYSFPNTMVNQTSKDYYKKTYGK